MDHGVQLAVHPDLETGGLEGVPVPHGVHPAGIGGGQLLRDAAHGPQLRRRVRVEGGADPALLEVVRVFVGDQQGVGSEARVGFAEGARVDDERAPVLLQLDAGVQPFGEVHGATLDPAGYGTVVETT